MSSRISKLSEGCGSDEGDVALFFVEWNCQQSCFCLCPRWASSKGTIALPVTRAFPMCGLRSRRSCSAETSMLLRALAASPATAVMLRTRK